MGTPDLQGTYGTFAFYTDVPEQYEGASGGTVFPVRVDEQTVHAKLVGPRNDFRREAPASTLDFSVFVDASHPVVQIEVDGQRVQLAEKQWSDWVRISFELAPLVARVRGICRFYLKEVRPHFKLYVSPINIDPASPALPSRRRTVTRELQISTLHIKAFSGHQVPCVLDVKFLNSRLFQEARRCMHERPGPPLSLQ
jgi:hypothetical protein